MEKVIIVGPTDLHTFFTANYNEWDTQIPVEQVAHIWDGLRDGTLSAESSAVIFTDANFVDVNERAGIVEAVATFASEAIVLVIFYDRNNYESFLNDVKAKQEEFNSPEGEFFPVDASGDVGATISAAFEYRDAMAAQQDVIPEQIENVSYEPAVDVSTRKRGLIVASTSSKGGSGKTTVGLLTASMFYHASLAAVQQGLREEPLKVCVVDMDVRDGQIGFIIKKMAPTALNVYLETEKNFETVSQHLVHDPNLGVHVLLAPKRARTAEFLSPEFYRLIIDILADEFDVVVLDTSVDYTNVLLSKVVFPIADAIMFVTNLSVGSVYGMNRWMDEVTLSEEEGGPNVPKSKIGVVVNQSAPNIGIDEELLRRAAAGAELLVAIPLDTTGVVAASNHNRLSDVIKLHTEISPAYYSIITQLLPNEVFADPLEHSKPDNNRRASSTPEPSSTGGKKRRKSLGNLFS